MYKRQSLASATSFFSKRISTNLFNAKPSKSTTIKEDSNDSNRAVPKRQLHLSKNQILRSIRKLKFTNKFKHNKKDAEFFNEYFDTFEQFNDKYPNADFFEINNLFESAILALNQNLYMPLFIIDMMISLQTLLKGEKPKIII